MFAVAALLTSSSALAQTSAEDRAAADALYGEAGVLMKAGRFADACPKLETSERLDPGLGTLIRLGFCYENVGRTASAWSAFNDAEAVAKKTGDKRADLAAEHAKALAPKLSRLLIAAAPLVAGFAVVRDGKPVDAGVLGAPVPVDPGDHAIEASAPGQQPWRGTVRVDIGPVTATIAIPALLPAVGPVLEASPPSPYWNGQRIAGVALGSAGAAGLLLGAITLGLDGAKYGSFIHQCQGARCPLSVQPQIDSYHTIGVVSSTSLIVGGVLGATGLIVALATPKAEQSPPRVSPVVGLGYTGLMVRF